jgi:hypothetical protein
MTLRRAATTVAVAAASVLLLAGCGAPDDKPTPTDSASAVVPDSPAATSSTPTPDAEAAPTCDTLILPEVVESLTAEGWTAETDTFRIGATEVPEGLWCVWGDYSVASDHVQIYGWAPVDDATAQDARETLIASGWQVVSDPSGDFVTENPGTVLAPDDDGYGMTYRFGDGWVTVSDTKQGLLLIQRPGA